MPAPSPACNVSGATWAATTTRAGQFTNTPGPVGGGAIAGIVVGVLVAVAAAALVAILVLRHFGYIGARGLSSAASTGPAYNKF